MSLQRRRSGFTLIEVLIVVVILAVLSAMIIPQFSSSVKDSKESALKFNLSTMRSQVELFKHEHNGVLPSGVNNLDQLTNATNVSGAIGEKGPDYPLGPYVQNILPPNPFTNSNKVRLNAGTGTPSASGAIDAGWIYRPSTGELWADHADYLNF